MIRFLKNIKADSILNINFSSFDINSICYDIEAQNYIDKTYRELVYILYAQLLELRDNQTKRDSLMSVDGTEYIFRNNPSKTASLNELIREINSLLTDLKQSEGVFV